MNIKIEIDGKEVKSALIKEILEQDTLRKAASAVVKFQKLMKEARDKQDSEQIEKEGKDLQLQFRFDKIRKD